MVLQRGCRRLRSLLVNVVIRVPANHDNSHLAGGTSGADLIDEELEEANHYSSMVVAAASRSSDVNDRLGDVVHKASKVAGHHSGFDHSSNISQAVG